MNTWLYIASLHFGLRDFILAAGIAFYLAKENKYRPFLLRNAYEM